MDEQIEAIYIIAIECLANLIAPQKDEVSNNNQTSIEIQMNFSRKFFLKQRIGPADIINRV
jgi:hypothetical protein